MLKPYNNPKAMVVHFEKVHFYQIKNKNEGFLYFIISNLNPLIS
jgi:hypothetical protein